MSLISEKNIPCFIEQEDYNIIEQLYYQDFGYFQSVETPERKSYLSQKYNEHYENMGDRTYCFIQELSIAMEQPIDAFEAWLMHQKRIDLRSKLDAFYTELAQTSIYYGILNDTAYQDSLYWKEQHLYGSSRLGIAKPELEVTNYTPSNFSLLTSNFRNYELTNHLGNILATIKDEKQQIDQNADGIVDYYEPIVITANDYYPFGMVMPNRSFSLGGSNYRFGFNGVEKDNELYGAGNTMDFKFRVYDARIGRFFSQDPLFKEYPWNSTYAFAENRVNDCIELEGAEALSIHVRSFISEKTTRDPLFREYDGDGRPATTSENVTARGRAKIDYDYKTKIATQPYKPYANETKRRDFFGGSSSKIGVINAEMAQFDVENVKLITLHYDTKNPLTPKPLTPAVDVDAVFAIDYNKKDNSWNISFDIKSNEYPSTEAFVESPSGQRIMFSNRKETGSPLFGLPGNADQQVGKGMINIKLDKNYKFESASKIEGKSEIPLIINEPTSK